MKAAFILLIIKLVITCALSILSVINLYWLHKVYQNAKDEPDNRIKFYSLEDTIIDVIDLYEPGEFCYKHYQPFIDKGVFENFDISMKKIKKYSLALWILLLISFLTGVIHIEFDLPDSFVFTCCNRSDKSYKIFMAVNRILNLLSTILAFIFFILVSVYYFKVNFDDYDEFSKCEYLNSHFENEYDFINVVKKNYLRFFIGYIVALFLNFSYMIISIILSVCYKVYDN